MQNKGWRFVVTLVLILALTVSVIGCSTSNKEKKEINSNKQSSTESDSAKDSKKDDKKSEKKETVTFLSWDNEENMKPVLEGFKAKYPNITVDFQYSPPVKDYIQKLQTMLLAGSDIDVFVMAYENKEDVISAGYAMDLTNEPFMERASAFNKNTFTRDGKVYAFAQTAWAGGIYYNKDLFEKAGISKEPNTWDELLDTCKKLQDAGIQPFVDNCQDAAVNMVSALYAAETISENPDYDDDVIAGKATYADGWTEPMKMWYEGMVKPGYMTSEMLGITWEQMHTEFANGKVAMILGGPWCVGFYNGVNPDFKNYKVMPVPGKKPDNKWFFGAAGVGFAVNKETKNKDAALKFLGYLASDEGLQKYHEGTTQMISAKNFTHDIPRPLIDAKKGMDENKLYLPMGGWKLHTEALRSQYIMALQESLVEQITPEEAAKSLDDKFNELKKD